MNSGSIDQFKGLLKRLLYSVRALIRVDVIDLEVKGPIYIGKLIGDGGMIEVLYGPPEYHVELFITLSSTKERYNLARMITVKGVREWMENNRPNITHDKLTGEFEWIEAFLLNGIRNNEEFANLYRKD